MHGQQSHDQPALLGARRDRVDETLVELELRALETGRQRLLYRPLDDARTGEPDERAGLCDVNVPELREDRGDAAGGRVAENDDQRLSGLLASSEAAGVLGRSVEIRDGDGIVRGIVDKVVRGDAPMVSVNGKIYDFSQVESVIE